MFEMAHVALTFLPRYSKMLESHKFDAELFPHAMPVLHHFILKIAVHYKKLCGLCLPRCGSGGFGSFGELVI